MKPVGQYKTKLLQRNSPVSEAREQNIINIKMRVANRACFTCRTPPLKGIVFTLTGGSKGIAKSVIFLYKIKEEAPQRILGVK